MIKDGFKLRKRGKAAEGSASMRILHVSETIPRLDRYAFDHRMRNGCLKDFRKAESG